MRSSENPSASASYASSGRPGRPQHGCEAAQQHPSHERHRVPGHDQPAIPRLNSVEHTVECDEATHPHLVGDPVQVRVRLVVPVFQQPEHLVDVFERAARVTGEQPDVGTGAERIGERVAPCVARDAASSIARLDLDGSGLDIPRREEAVGAVVACRGLLVAEAELAS